MVVTGKENDETKKTWSEADVHCMMHGGDLASIHGEDEMLAIADAIGGVSDVWIGLQKDSKYTNLRSFGNIIIPSRIDQSNFIFISSYKQLALVR